MLYSWKLKNSSNWPDSFKTLVDIDSYLAKALIYYIKAKLAEDQMEINQKEYFMKEFSKMIEKNESGKFNGYRHAIAGQHAIR